MGRITTKVRKGDWKSASKAVDKLASAKLGTGASPVFNDITVVTKGSGGLTISGLTASRLLGSNASKQVVSVADLTDYIAGTANQVVVTDNGNGTITLSLPQDVGISSTPKFDGLTSTGTIDASSGQVLVEDNDTVEPLTRADGYIGVAIVGGEPRIYFAVAGVLYYITGTAVEIPEATTGNPVGLLLAITYA
jgi:hypothetical protein